MIKEFSLAALFCAFPILSMAQPDNIPNAQPGRCYAKCYVPSRYETVVDQVMVQPASEEKIAIPAEFETTSVDAIVKVSYGQYVAEPAVFETVTEKIMVAPAGKKSNPAAYDMVRDSILIKPAVKRYTPVPPVFETVNEPVETEPAYTRLEVLPPVYDEILQRIETRPAGSRWLRKKAEFDCLGADPDDCFVWCLVEEPAQFEDIFKRVPRGCGGADQAECVHRTTVAAKTTPMAVQKVKTPASYTETVEPAEYQTITRWVLKPSMTEPRAAGDAEYLTVSKKVLTRPAGIREETVPAQTKPFTRKVLKSDARLELRPLPAEYTSVTKKRLVRAGGFPEWREIFCGEKLTGYTVRQIQEALRAMGYYKGTPDNAMNAATKAALIQFQQDRELPADGNVDYETLKALGVSY